MTGPRRIFRDAAVEAAFRRDGYVVLDGVDAASVEGFRSIVDSVYVGARDGFHATIRSGDFAYRRRVFESLQPAFEPLVDRLLDDYETFTSSLLIKWPSGDNEFCTHQDWTMVEEPAFRAVNLWLALDDLDHRNGTLAVLPGSHIHLDHLRCSPMNPVDFLSEGTDVELSDLVEVPVKAGQVLAFDSGLLHASGPNTTDAPRRVVVAACKPTEAPLLHYYLPDGGSWDVEVYEVPPEFFADFTIGERPRYPLARMERYRGSPRHRAQLLDLCRGGDGNVPREGDAPAAAEQVEATPAPSGAEAATERHPTFGVAELDAALEADGYVVVDLLAPEEIEELTRIVDEVYVDERKGFHASNLSSSHDYRRSADRAVRPIIDRAVGNAQLLEDHVAFTASLLVKWPGDDSAFHTHQDWTMVDETRFRTVNVWCPLVDVDEHNGAFAVLPGSHRVLGAIRCSPMPPAGVHSPGWEVTYDDMVKVPVRAGQAIVFDHALLHSSPPNRSDTWRPAVAAAFRPASSTLLHYYLPDPDRLDLEVFEVDEAFFPDFSIGDRPAYPLVGTAAFVPDELSRDDLLSSCGVAVAVAPPDVEELVEPDGPRDSAADDAGEPSAGEPGAVAAEPEVVPAEPEPEVVVAEPEAAELEPEPSPAPSVAPPPPLAWWQHLQILGSKPKRRLVKALKR